MGSFFGLLVGTATAMGHYLATDHLLHYSSVMAGNFWRATCAWTACFVVTVVLSFFTKPKDENDLVGLVYGASDVVKAGIQAWYKQPVTLAVIVCVITVIANVVFW